MEYRWRHRRIPWRQKRGYFIKWQIISAARCDMGTRRKPRKKLTNDKKKTLFKSKINDELMWIEKMKSWLYEPTTVGRTSSCKSSSNETQIFTKGPSSGIEMEAFIGSYGSAAGATTGSMTRGRSIEEASGCPGLVGSCCSKTGLRSNKVRWTRHLLQPIRISAAREATVKYLDKEKTV